MGKKFKYFCIKEVGKMVGLRFMMQGLFIYTKLYRQAKNIRKKEKKQKMKESKE